MKIKLEKIAKIDSADIEIKDLTIFVGKNSTNKSYMAHTIYMINKILSKLELDNFDNFDNISTLFEKYIKDSSQNYIYILDILKNLKTTTSIRKSNIEDMWEFEDITNIREVTFDFSFINLDEITLDIKKFIVTEIIYLLNQSFNIDRNIIKNIIFQNHQKNINELLKNNQITIKSNNKKEDYIILLNKIFEIIIKYFFRERIAKKEFYFPASRTGFVLAFDEIVSGVLRGRFGGQPTATKLTEPTIDFISGFADIKSGKFRDGFWRLEEDNTQKEKIKKLFKFIEDRVVKGKIIEENLAQNYTQFYLQTNNREKLDLHLISSATVELLPLIIFLKHFSQIDDRLLVIEEPEAHLHPKAQIEMARLLVMLVNSGAKVLITTHSDYILNELSNCIKLDRTENNFKEEYLKKYSLDKDTIISSDRVSAYLFRDIDSQKTEVQELVIDEYGVANDNFDDILDELLDRTDEINGMVI